eukprot:3418319-Karenia_brevis.AAC.1
MKGSQLGSGASRSDQLVLSPQGQRGEANLFRGADLVAAAAASVNVAFDHDDDDLASEKEKD